MDLVQCSLKYFLTFYTYDIMTLFYSIKTYLKFHQLIMTIFRVPFSYSVNAVCSISRRVASLHLNQMRARTYTQSTAAVLQYTNQNIFNCPRRMLLSKDRRNSYLYAWISLSSLICVYMTYIPLHIIYLFILLRYIIFSLYIYFLFGNSKKMMMIVMIA